MNVEWNLLNLMESVGARKMQLFLDVKAGGNMKNTYVNISPILLWDLLLEHCAEQTQMEVSW